MNHLVLVAVDSLDRSPELIRDVQLVGVEKQQNAVNPLSEPLERVFRGVIHKLAQLWPDKSST